MNIEDIHNSIVNGQRKQAVKQMDEYGVYDFVDDYAEYLGAIYSPLACFEYLKQATSSYFKINR